MSILRVPKVFKDIELAIAVRAIEKKDRVSIENLKTSSPETIVHLYEHYLKNQETELAERVARVALVRAYAVYTAPNVRPEVRSSAYASVNSWFARAKLLKNVPTTADEQTIKEVRRR